MLSRTREHAAVLGALDRSQGRIDLTPVGPITFARPGFLRAVGYDLAEIEGRHHATLVAEAERDDPAYASFWATLRRGEVLARQFRRVGRAGARSGSKRATRRSWTGAAVS